MLVYNLEKAMAPHSSILAWKIPWMEEPGWLQSMRSLRVRHDWATSLWLFTFMHWRRKWQPTPVFLPGEPQGQGEPGQLPSVGSHRVGHDWSDLAAAAATIYNQNKYKLLMIFLLFLRCCISVIVLNTNFMAAYCGCRNKNFLVVLSSCVRTVVRITKPSYLGTIASFC